MFTECSRHVGQGTSCCWAKGKGHKGKGESSRKVSKKLSKLERKTNKHFKKLFAKGDVDKSGSIDYEEFASMVGAGDVMTIRTLFKLLDADGSGTLELAEMKRVILANPKALKLAKQFKSFDAVTVDATKSRRPTI